MSDVRTTAEQLAAQSIRRGLEDGLNLDTRALARIADTTGLTLSEVSALRDRIVSGKRPQRPSSPPALRAVPPGATADPRPAAEGWRSAADHPDRAIRDLYGKACTAVAALDGALRAYEQDGALRRRQAELEAELEKVRAQLGDTHPCHECTRTFASVQALGVHRARSHKAGAS